MILFLDIDGVLHPDPATADQAFSKRQLKWRLWKFRPFVPVEISSNWRLRRSLSERTGFILADGGQKFKNRFIGTLAYCRKEETNVAGENVSVCSVLRSPVL